MFAAGNFGRNGFQTVVAPSSAKVLPRDINAHSLCLSLPFLTTCIPMLAEHSVHRSRAKLHDQVSRARRCKPCLCSTESGLTLTLPPCCDRVDAETHSADFCGSETDDDDVSIDQTLCFFSGRGLCTACSSLILLTITCMAASLTSMSLTLVYVGPTRDLRVKPEILVPGEWIISARSNGDPNEPGCSSCQCTCLCVQRQHTDASH